MKVLNIPLGLQSEVIFKNYFLQHFEGYLPNFSKFLILVPSKSLANSLKKTFSSGANVIMPKILSINDAGDEFLAANINGFECSNSTSISNIKAKVMLCSIVKNHFPNASFSWILGYMEDFLFLENLTLQNQTDLALSLANTEHLTQNLAAFLQNSLINFLKIYLEWQIFKRENKLLTEFEKGIQVINGMLVCNFEKFEKVFLFGMQGSDKMQQSLIQHIYSLQNGVLVFNTGSLTSHIQTATQIEKTPQTPFFFYTKYENTHTKAISILLNIRHILEQKQNAKIGIICYSFQTGFLISEMLQNEGLSPETVFTESIMQGSIFQLFLLFLRPQSLECYLTLIKSSLTIFDKEKAKMFESTLRSPNLNANKPFKIAEVKGSQNFTNYINASLENFQNILTPEAKGEEFEKFTEFIKEITSEIGTFCLPQNTEYIEFLKLEAKNKILKQKGGGSIFVLSAIEARSMIFDYTFITDVSSSFLPSPSNDNKILNSFLQEVLEVNTDKKATQWLDFESCMFSAPNVFLCFSAIDFEGGKANELSSFALKFMQKYTFKTHTTKYYTQNHAAIEAPNPIFLKQFLPQKLTPTSFERLITNPYSFYAYYILKLKNLTPVREEIERMHLGTIIHKAIYLFFHNGQNIKDFCEETLKKLGFYYSYLLYLESFAKIQEFFVQEREFLNKNIPTKVIMEEEIRHEALQTLFYAKPDRIEFYEDEIKIIDYKVYASQISSTEVASGAKPQLPFEGFIITKSMPTFNSKISLYYYFINLNSRGEVVTKKDVSITNYEVVQNSVEKLFFNLQTFMYKEDEDVSLKYLVRVYE